MFSHSLTQDATVMKNPKPGNAPAALTALSFACDGGLGEDFHDILKEQCATIRKGMPGDSRWRECREVTVPRDADGTHCLPGMKSPLRNEQLPIPDSEKIGVLPSKAHPNEPLNRMDRGMVLNAVRAALHATRPVKNTAASFSEDRPFALLRTLMRGSGDDESAAGALADRTGSAQPSVSASAVETAAPDRTPGADHDRAEAVMGALLTGLPGNCLLSGRLAAATEIVSDAGGTPPPSLALGDRMGSAQSSASVPVVETAAPDRAVGNSKGQAEAAIGALLTGLLGNYLLSGRAAATETVSDGGGAPPPSLALADRTGSAQPSVSAPSVETSAPDRAVGNSKGQAEMAIGALLTGLPRNYLLSVGAAATETVSDGGGAPPPSLALADRTGSAQPSVSAPSVETSAPDRAVGNSKGQAEMAIGALLTGLLGNYLLSGRAAATETVSDGEGAPPPSLALADRAGSAQPSVSAPSVETSAPDRAVGNSKGQAEAAIGALLTGLLGNYLLSGRAAATETVSDGGGAPPPSLALADRTGNAQPLVSAPSVETSAPDRAVGNSKGQAEAARGALLTGLGVMAPVSKELPLELSRILEIVGRTLSPEAVSADPQGAVSGAMKEAVFHYFKGQGAGFGNNQAAMQFGGGTMQESVYAPAMGNIMKEGPFTKPGTTNPGGKVFLGADSGVSVQDERKGMLQAVVDEASRRQERDGAMPKEGSTRLRSTGVPAAGSNENEQILTRYRNEQTSPAGSDPGRLSLGASWERTRVYRVSSDALPGQQAEATESVRMKGVPGYGAIVSKEKGVAMHARQDVKKKSPGKGGLSDTPQSPPTFISGEVGKEAHKTDRNGQSLLRDVRKFRLIDRNASERPAQGNSPDVEKEALRQQPESGRQVLPSLSGGEEPAGMKRFDVELQERALSQKEAVSTNQSQPTVRHAQAVDSFPGTEMRAPADDRPVKTEMLVERVLAAVSNPAKGGVNRVKIALNPPNMGTMDMEVIVRDKMVRVVFRVEGTEVSRFLNANVEQLRNSLAGQGLTVDSILVSGQGEQASGERYGSAQGGQFFQHEGNRSGNHAGEKYGGSMTAQKDNPPEAKNATDHLHGMVSLFV